MKSEVTLLYVPFSSQINPVHTTRPSLYFSIIHAVPSHLIWGEKNTS
jgi:hypothetical protein